MLFAGASPKGVWLCSFSGPRGPAQQVRQCDMAAAGTWGRWGCSKSLEAGAIVCCYWSNTEKWEVKNRKEIPSPSFRFSFSFYAEPNKNPGSWEEGRFSWHHPNHIRQKRVSERPQVSTSTGVSDPARSHCRQRREKRMV